MVVTLFCQAMLMGKLCLFPVTVDCGGTPDKPAVYVVDLGWGSYAYGVRPLDANKRCIVGNLQFLAARPFEPPESIGELRTTVHVTIGRPPGLNPNGKPWTLFFWVPGAKDPKDPAKRWVELTETRSSWEQLRGNGIGITSVSYDKGLDDKSFNGITFTLDLWPDFDAIIGWDG